MMKPLKPNYWYRVDNDLLYTDLDCKVFWLHGCRHDTPWRRDEMTAVACDDMVEVGPVGDIFRDLQKEILKKLRDGG